MKPRAKPTKLVEQEVLLARTPAGHLTPLDERRRSHGVPPPACGVRNTAEQAMPVLPEHACGAYIGLVGP
jgi:hypothetical protein